VPPSPRGPAASGRARLPEPGPAEPVAPEPARAADSTVAVSASAIERLRSTMAGRIGLPTPRTCRCHRTAGSTPLNRCRAAAGRAAPEPKTAAVDTLKEPRLDFLFRSRPAPPARRESFDAMWRSAAGLRNSPGSRMPARTPRRRHRSRNRAALRRRRGRPSARGTAPVGCDPQIGRRRRHGLYALCRWLDRGAAAAGTVRFGSIAELRAHIENNS